LASKIRLRVVVTRAKSFWRPDELAGSDCNLYP
jgi:hypothetical protein